MDNNINKKKTPIAIGMLPANQKTIRIGSQLISTDNLGVLVGVTISCVCVWFFLFFLFFEKGAIS